MWARLFVYAWKLKWRIENVAQRARSIINCNRLYFTFSPRHTWWRPSSPLLHPRNVLSWYIFRSLAECYASVVRIKCICDLLPVCERMRVALSSDEFQLKFYSPKIAWNIFFQTSKQTQSYGFWSAPFIETTSQLIHIRRTACDWISVDSHVFHSSFDF